jgi:hypothetical protein
MELYYSSNSKEEVNKKLWHILIKEPHREKITLVDLVWELRLCSGIFIQSKNCAVTTARRY